MSWKPSKQSALTIEKRELTIGRRELTTGRRELVTENPPCDRPLVTLIRHFGWSGGGQSLMRVECRNPLTAIGDSSLSSNTAILSQPLIIFVNSQVRSCDSLGYFFSASRIKFQLFSMTFNLYFLLLLFWHLLRRLLHQP